MVYDRFGGHYVGAAIAIDGGDLTIPLTANCSLIVDGDYHFHQEVSEAWDKSQYGFRVLRAVNVDLVGQIEWHEWGGNRYPVLELSQEGHVTHEIERTAAEAAFYDRMRRSIDGEIID